MNGTPAGRLFSRIRGSAWFQGRTLLGALLLLVALVSTRGEWLSFPLSAPLRAIDIRWEWGGAHPLPVGLAFRLLVIGACVMSIVSRLSGVVLACGAMVLLAVVPIQAAFYRVSWLETYVRESTERLLFGAYENLHFVQNLSPEPTFAPVDRFESIAEQLGVGMVMLGWGWYIAVGATFSLVFVLLRGWRVPWRGPLVGAIVLALSVAAFAAPVRSVLQAQWAQDRGDQYLLDGNGVAAIDSYARALENNPALAYSTPFLGKASMAFNVATGGRHALGELGQDLDLTTRHQNEDLLQSYQEARTRLMDSSDSQLYRASSLEQALSSASLRVRSDLWLAEGVIHANAGRYSEALGAYLRMTSEPDSLSSFYLAHAYLTLGNARAAVPLLEELDRHVVQPSIHADIRCTLGDAYTAAGDIIRARDLYRTCRELDRIDNFRAVKALSGT